MVHRLHAVVFGSCLLGLALVCCHGEVVVGEGPESGTLDSTPGAGSLCASAGGTCVGSGASCAEAAPAAAQDCEAALPRTNDSYQQDPVCCLALVGRDDASDPSDGGASADGGVDATLGQDGSSKKASDGGSREFDVVLPPLDAALASLDAAPAGQAGFALIVNDVVQHPMACTGEDWEFAPYPGSGGAGCAGACKGGCSCPGIESVLLVNTGALEMPYLAGPVWTLPGSYAPGGDPGGDFLAGVLPPGTYVDITSFYNSGITALLGSAQPFSTNYAMDEGEIGWPVGVGGSGGATTMYVAEIEVFKACQSVEKVW